MQNQCCVESLYGPIFSTLALSGLFLMSESAFCQKICTLNQVSGSKVKFIADLYESLSGLYGSPLCPF